MVLNLRWFLAGMAESPAANMYDVLGRPDTHLLCSVAPVREHRVPLKTRVSKTKIISVHILKQVENDSPRLVICNYYGSILLKAHPIPDQSSETGITWKVAKYDEKGNPTTIRSSPDRLAFGISNLLYNREIATLNSESFDFASIGLAVNTLNCKCVCYIQSECSKLFSSYYIHDVLLCLRKDNRICHVEFRNPFLLTNAHNSLLMFRLLHLLAKAGVTRWRLQRLSGYMTLKLVDTRVALDFVASNDGGKLPLDVVSGKIEHALGKVGVEFSHSKFKSLVGPLSDGNHNPNSTVNPSIQNEFHGSEPTKSNDRGDNSRDTQSLVSDVDQEERADITEKGSLNSYLNEANGENYEQKSVNTPPVSLQLGASDQEFATNPCSDIENKSQQNGYEKPDSDSNSSVNEPTALENHEQSVIANSTIVSTTPVNPPQPSTSTASGPSKNIENGFDSSSIAETTARPSSPPQNSEVSATTDNCTTPENSLCNDLPPVQNNINLSLDDNKGVHAEVMALESSTPRKSPLDSKPGFSESLKRRSGPSVTPSTEPQGVHLPTSTSRQPNSSQEQNIPASPQPASSEIDIIPDPTLSSDSRALGCPGNSSVVKNHAHEKQYNAPSSSPQKKLQPHPVFAGHPNKIQNYSNSELLEIFRSHVASAKAATPPVTSSSQHADFSLPINTGQGYSEDEDQSSDGSIDDIAGISVAAEPPSPADAEASLLPAPSPEPETQPQPYPQPLRVSEPTTPPPAPVEAISAPAEVPVLRTPPSEPLPRPVVGSRPLPIKKNFQDLINENKISMNAEKRRFEAISAPQESPNKKRSEPLIRTTKVAGNSGGKPSEVNSTNGAAVLNEPSTLYRADKSSKLTPRIRKPTAVDYRTSIRSGSTSHASKFRDSRPRRLPIRSIAQESSVSNFTDLRDRQESHEGEKEANCYREPVPASNGESNGNQAAGSAEPESTENSRSRGPCFTNLEHQHQDTVSVGRETSNTMHNRNELPTQSQSPNQDSSEEQPGNSENPHESVLAGKAWDISPPKAVSKNSEPVQEVFSDQSTEMSKPSEPELAHSEGPTSRKALSITEAPIESRNPPQDPILPNSRTPGTMPNERPSSIASECSILSPSNASMCFQPSPTASPQIASSPSIVDSPVEDNSLPTIGVQPPVEPISHSILVPETPLAFNIASSSPQHPNPDLNDCIHAEVTTDLTGDPNPGHGNLSTNIFGQSLTTENFLSPGEDEAVSIKFRNGKKKLRIRIKFD